MAKKKIVGKNRKAKVLVGVGLGLAALAAGAYAFAGKRGARNRRAVAGWAKAAERTVHQKVKQLKKIDRETYHKLVDSALRSYQAVKNVNTEELSAVTKELKSRWGEIAREVKKVGASAAKTVRRAAGRKSR